MRLYHVPDSHGEVAVVAHLEVRLKVITLRGIRFDINPNKNLRRLSFLIPARRDLCQKKARKLYEPRARLPVRPGGLYKRRLDGTLSVSY